MNGCMSPSQSSPLTYSRLLQPHTLSSTGSSTYTGLVHADLLQWPLKQHLGEAVKNQGDLVPAKILKYYNLKHNQSWLF